MLPMAVCLQNTFMIKISIPNNTLLQENVKSDSTKYIVKKIGPWLKNNSDLPLCVTKIPKIKVTYLIKT
jgi:hypothetical protein